MQRWFGSGLAVAFVIALAACGPGESNPNSDDSRVGHADANATREARVIWRRTDQPRAADCTRCGATSDRLDVVEIRADGAVIWVDLTHSAVFPDGSEREAPEPEVFASVNECPVPSPPMSGTVLFNRADQISTLMIDLTKVPDGQVSLYLRVFYVEQTLPRLLKVASRVDIDPQYVGAGRIDIDGEEVLSVPGTDCPTEGAR
jgi:hypothetical protein